MKGGRLRLSASLSKPYNMNNNIVIEILHNSNLSLKEYWELLHELENRNFDDDEDYTGTLLVSRNNQYPIISNQPSFSNQTA